MYNLKKFMQWCDAKYKAVYLNLVCRQNFWFLCEELDEGQTRDK
jgi:hypothetical protein